MRNPAAVRLGQVLNGVFERLEKGRQGKEGALFEEWPSWIGERAARHSRPVRVREGELTVYVDHPTWLYELNQSRRSLMTRIRERLGEGVVTRVRFRLGGV